MFFLLLIKFEIVLYELVYAHYVLGFFQKIWVFGPWNLQIRLMANLWKVLRLCLQQYIIFEWFLRLIKEVGPLPSLSGRYSNTCQALHLIKKLLILTDLPIKLQEHLGRLFKLNFLHFPLIPKNPYAFCHLLNLLKSKLLKPDPLGLAHGLIKLLVSRDVCCWGLLW